MYTFVKDHLGSVRAVVDVADSLVCEENDYYSYGGKFPSGEGNQVFDNRWGYSGKEEQETVSGLPYLDYGARFYDPSVCRWLSPDPLAEDYYGLSPYGFCAGNPVNFVDPDGKRRKCVIDYKHNQIEISSKFIYIDRKLRASVESAIRMLNNQKNLSYSIDGQVYKVNLNLSSQLTDSFESADRLKTENSNFIEIMKDSKYAKDGKVILGGTIDNKIKIRYSSVDDDFTVAHEMVHALGGNNPEGGIDRHSEDGLMVKSRTHDKSPQSEDIYQQTVNDIIEKGRGQNIEKHKLVQVLKKLKKNEE